MWASLVLLSVLTLNPIARGSVVQPTDCTQSLNSPITLESEIHKVFKQEFKLSLEEASRLERLSFYAIQKLRKHKNIQKCLEEKTCTALQIETMAQEIVLNHFRQYDLLKNTSIMLAGYATVAAISATVVVTLSPQLSFLPTFLQNFITPIIFLNYNLLSSFSEPIQVLMRKRGYQSRKPIKIGRNPQGSAQGKNLSDLDNQATLTDQHYSLRQQYAAERISKILILMQSLNAIRSDYTSGNQNTAYTGYMNLLYAHFKLFNDVGPENEHVALAYKSFHESLALHEKATDKAEFLAHFLKDAKKAWNHPPGLSDEKFLGFIKKIHFPD